MAGNPPDRHRRSIVTAICLIDTTILVELIDVPDKASDHDATVDRLADKIRAGESLFLPMAVVFETGNHIGQIRDGRLRRRCAEQFVKQGQGSTRRTHSFQTRTVPRSRRRHGLDRRVSRQRDAWYGAGRSLYRQGLGAAANAEFDETRVHMDARRASERLRSRTGKRA